MVYSWRVENRNRPTGFLSASKRFAERVYPWWCFLKRFAERCVTIRPESSHSQFQRFRQDRFLKNHKRQAAASTRKHWFLPHRRPSGPDLFRVLFTPGDQNNSGNLASTSSPAKMCLHFLPRICSARDCLGVVALQVESSVSTYEMESACLKSSG